VKKLCNYSKKFDKKEPSKSHREFLRYCSNDQIDSVTKALEEAEAAVDTVLKAKMA
jgi:hypothetical protein